MVTIKSGDIEKTIQIIQILSNKTSKLLDNLPSEPQKLWEELRNEISYQWLARIRLELQLVLN